jgi:Holliday junction DNA helicase RuvB
MEDFKIDIMIESGPNARTVQINLNPFTLIGATTIGFINSSYESTFWNILSFTYYTTEL